MSSERTPRNKVIYFEEAVEKLRKKSGKEEPPLGPTKTEDTHTISENKPASLDEFRKHKILVRLKKELRLPERAQGQDFDSWLGEWRGVLKKDFLGLSMLASENEVLEELGRKWEKEKKNRQG